MNGQKARAARHAASTSAPTRKSTEPSSLWKTWKGGVAGAIIAAAIAGSFVVPDVFDNKASLTSPDAMEMGVKDGAGLPPGSPVPAFSERDVETGKPITSATVYPGKTLLFFSEGVMCQACFQQIKGLERFGTQLDQRGIRLISITPDPPRDLRQAISQYGINTPMISDDDRGMSTAFNTLGKGMHGDTPGHAFALVGQGKVIWYRDYWLGPSQSMYVDPEELLADIPT